MMDVWTDHTGHVVRCQNTWSEDGWDYSCHEPATRGVIAQDLKAMCDGCSECYDEVAPVVYAELFLR